MISTADPALKEIVRLIVARFQPQQIILFGSRARGDAGPDSDIDLLVVEDNGRGARMPRLGDLYVDMAFMDRPPTDILLYNEDQFARWRNSPFHVIGRASREGRVIYERP